MIWIRVQKVLQRLESLLKQTKKEYIVVLLSEIFPLKLSQFKDIDAYDASSIPFLHTHSRKQHTPPEWSRWVQVACPRLSIDWGTAFHVPLLSPYEAEVALGAQEWKPVYPMDFYSKEGGPWSNYYHKTNS
jgi:2-(3-amino-3-carboxypropyl)histidine synthase